MSRIDETRTFERREFFSSQRLLDVDLNEREAFHREMRWLHNRSLHQPGVGNGYSVTGKKDDRTVMIGPGYAIDAMGREIILTRAVEEAVPSVDGEAKDNGIRPAFFYLAVAYPGDELLDEAEMRLGNCGSRGAVRLSERPLLRWIPLTVDESLGSGVLIPKDEQFRRDVNSGGVIVLALIQVFQCRLNCDITEKSFLPRRSARPPRLPFTASAVEVRPAWKCVNNGLPAPATPPAAGFLPALVRLEATVKVGAATFGAIPRYFVRVSDPGDDTYELAPFVFRDDLLSSPPPPPPPPPPLTDVVYIEPRLEVLLDDHLTDHTKFTVSVSLLVYTATSTIFSHATGGLFTPDLNQIKLDLIRDEFIARWSIVWIGVEG